MRNGQSISVDFAAAITIFLFGLGAAVFLMQASVFAAAGLSEQVERVGQQSFERFSTTTRWTLEQTPIIIRSPQKQENEPVDLTFPFSRTVLPNSVVVARNGQEIRSQHGLVRNNTVFVADLNPGVNLFQVVASSTINLSDRTYTADLDAADDAVWNENVNLTVTANGLSGLQYKDLDVIEPAADLGTGTVPIIIRQLLRANITYNEADRTSLYLYEDSSRIRAVQQFSGGAAWRLNLTSNFSTMYVNGSTTSLSGSGTFYDDTTDFIDFYSVRGLAITGNDLDVTVQKPSSGGSVDVSVSFTASPGDEIWLTLHDGNHTNALPEQDKFFDPYTATIGAPASITGISRTRAAALETQDYDEIRSLLGLEGLDYNITVPGVFSKGQPVPRGVTVSALSFPVAVLHRFGNATMNQVEFRVWTR